MLSIGFFSRRMWRGISWLTTDFDRSPQESSSGEVDLTDSNLYLVQRLMSFFYDEDYSDPTEGDENKEVPLSALELHAEMYALGDKYQAPGLSRLATQKYERSLKRDWVPEDFLRSIAKVYQLTPESNRELRNAVLHHARSNIKQFQSNDAMRIQFKDTNRGVPEFTSDLLQSYIDVPLRGKCIQCGPLQPIQPLQARCLKCGKGGAWWEHDEVI